MEHWYTLYTQPHLEPRVAATLDENGIETYWPVIKDFKKSPEGKLVSFFPCYLFMKADLDTVAPSQWRWTPGLRYMVTFDNVPVPINDQAIDLIQQKLDELNNASGRPPSKFVPGDVVRVTSGPFADLLALFEGPKTPAERVTVFLDFLGRLSRVQLDITDLEKAPPGTEIAPQKRPRRTRGGGRVINRSL